MRLNLPIYNSAGLRELGRLRPFLRPDDLLMLVSGNVDRPLDEGWLAESLAHLADAYGGPRVLLATAGLAHLEHLAGAGLPAQGLVYIYEPNFHNVPEFSWEAAPTLANVTHAAEMVRAAGLEVGFKPTGRPLFQPYLFKHGWNYGTFAETTDLLLVQTQTYCHKGNFAGAAAKLGLECAAQLGKTFVQVTVDPAARNGIPPDRALRCVQEALLHGFAGVTLWWSPRQTDAAAHLMQRRPV